VNHMSDTALLADATDVETACGTASVNLMSKIDVGSAFPRNVFVGSWACFFFFDSDWMLELDFVPKVSVPVAFGHKSTCCSTTTTQSIHK
jgi:hypothetical protein